MKPDLKFKNPFCYYSLTLYFNLKQNENLVSHKNIENIEYILCNNILKCNVYIFLYIW